MKIAICSDHAGFEYKNIIIEYLKNENIEVKDFGPITNDICDYPDYIHPLAKAVANKEYDFGVAICGGGVGMAMVANRYKGVRCAPCWNSDIAKLTREHQDANILALSAVLTAKGHILTILKTFLQTKFEGGVWCTRIDKIDL